MALSFGTLPRSSRDREDFSKTALRSRRVTCPKRGGKGRSTRPGKFGKSSGGLGADSTILFQPRSFLKVPDGHRCIGIE